MIEFSENRIPEKRLTTLTAYISEVELANRGKNFATEVVRELVKQSVLVHRIDLENIVDDIIRSTEIREYVQARIRDMIDEAIKLEIAEMFNKDK